MPLLSLVLVVADEQPDLGERVAGLVGAELDDVELIAIDDAAPAATAAALDALAGRDPRIRVLRQAVPIGTGPARNLGLEHATGDYVWFLAPTGRPAPGALAGVAEQLRAGSPDVLLVDRGAPGRLLARVAADGATTLDRRPRLATTAAHAADKIMRRAHLQGLGVRFGAGAGGELPVTWPALLAAGSIAAAPAARSVTGDDHGAPLERLANCDAVLAFVAAHPELPDGRRRLVLPAMLREELARLERLPERERPASFAALSEFWKRHRRGDEPVQGRAAALQVRAVERGDYRAFRALGAALRTRAALARRRRGLTRRGRRALGAVRRRRLERHYRARLREPLDPNLAVFAAYWYRGYACNPRAIYEKARELVPAMRGVWVVKPGAGEDVPAGVETVVRGTPEYYDVIARASVFVNNVNFPNHLVKREGTVHVMTHHGTPLKTMGMDLKDTPIAGAKMDFDALLRRCARWDFSVSSNRFSTEIWERVYPTGYESLEVGYPRNDVLVNAGEDEVRRVREELGIAPGQVAILYAPTHREHRSSYVPVLDPAAVAEALGPDHVVLARAHYFYDADPSPRHEGRVRDVAAHPSVEELCLAADVLVTDYSSIMFDYAVLDRPIVIHAPDWEAYRALRGTYFDLLAEPPGLVARTEDEVIAALRSGELSGEEATRARAAFRSALLLAGGRARGRACGPPRLARGARGGRPAPRAGRPMSGADDRRLVLVVGVGRSGTSLLSGILGQLGLHIPQPEVNADSTNPRGFGEPRWVVDFHTKLLNERRVTVNDARPVAWDVTGRSADSPDAYRELLEWLRGQMDRHGAVVVKDPRTSWFLPLWMRCSTELGVPPVFVTMLRHPAETLASARQVLRHLADGGQPRRRVAQRVARDRARHARPAPRVRPLRGPARRLAARGRSPRRGPRAAASDLDRPGPRGAGRRVRRPRAASQPRALG